MSRKILQVNFSFHASRAEYEVAVAPLVEPTAATPGLLWQVWLMNQAGQEAGCIYLFADARSLDSYLNSEAMATLVNHPLLSDPSVKQFDVTKGASEVMGGPVGAAIARGARRKGVSP
jgi:hypothetical protein